MHLNTLRSAGMRTHAALLVLAVAVTLAVAVLMASLAPGAGVTSRGQSAVAPVVAEEVDDFNQNPRQNAAARGLGSVPADATEPEAFNQNPRQNPALRQ